MRLFLLSVVWPGTESGGERVLQAERARDREGQMVMRGELCVPLRSVGRRPRAEVGVLRELLFRLCFLFATLLLHDTAGF